MYTPVNPSFTIQKWGLRGSTLYRQVFVMRPLLEMIKHLPIWIVSMRSWLWLAVTSCLYIFGLWCNCLSAPVIHIQTLKKDIQGNWPTINIQDTDPQKSTYKDTDPQSTYKDTDPQKQIMKILTHNQHTKIPTNKNQPTKILTHNQHRPIKNNLKRYWPKWTYKDTNTLSGNTIKGTGYTKIHYSKVHVLEFQLLCFQHFSGSRFFAWFFTHLPSMI